MGTTHFTHNFYLKELMTNHGYSDLSKWQKIFKSEQNKPVTLRKTTDSIVTKDKI